MIPIYIELDKDCEQCKWKFSVGGLIDSATCPSCGHENPLGHRWKTAFESVLSDVRALPGGTPQSLGWMSEPQEIRWGSEPPTCNDCGTALPLPSLVDSTEGSAAPYRADPTPDEQSYPCPGCNATYRFRKTPAERSRLLPGVTHLVGERAAPPRPAPVRVSCPHCQAPLGTDGSKRELLCGGCLQYTDVPDAVWRQFLSAKKTIRWYLLYQEEVLATTFSDREDIKAVITDASGNFYFIGVRGGTFSFEKALLLWSRDATLRERWAIALGDDWKSTLNLVVGPSFQLLLAPNGELYVRGRRKHKLYRYSSSTGELLGTLGGRETEAARVHQLDLEDCTALACDPDGTLLACIHERLLRFDASGQGIPTWPARTGISSWFGSDPAPSPLYSYAPGRDRAKRRGADVSPDSMGSRPHEMDDRAKMFFGPDQRLYIIASHWFYVYDRQGKQLLKKNIDNLLDVGIHTSGKLYLLRREDGRRLYLIEDLASEPVILQQEQKFGGDLGPEEFMIVCDETIWLMDDYGAYRSFGLDGRLLLISDASKKKDEERRREREREHSS